METITKNVKDIDTDDRLALEHVIGRPLAENQQVVINVVDIGATVPHSEAATDPAAQEIPDWWKVYEGLSEEEVDRLDVAIRQRANLTRIFE